MGGGVGAGRKDPSSFNEFLAHYLLISSRYHNCSMNELITWFCFELCFLLFIININVIFT